MTHETGNIASGEEDWGTFHCVPFQNITSLYLFIFGSGGSSLFWGLFSGCGGWGLLCGCVCGLLTAGAPLAGEQGLQGMPASAAVAQELSSRGSWALEHKLWTCVTPAYLLQGMWDLPSSGVRPMSPEFAGGFFTTAPHLRSPHSIPFSTVLGKKLPAACIIDSINTWILKTTQKDKWSQKVPMTVLD